MKTDIFNRFTGNLVFWQNKINAYQYLPITSKEDYQLHLSTVFAFKGGRRVRDSKRHFIAVITLMVTAFLTSCSVNNQSIKYPNYHIEFYKADFEYSKQVSAEATSIRVLGIDWKRLFNWETGLIDSDRFNEIGTQNVAISGSIVESSIVGGISAIVPVLGDYGKGKVSRYALYKLMRNNPGYDVIIYPRYEIQRNFFPFIYSKRTVKVTARLGKIK